MIEGNLIKMNSRTSLSKQRELMDNRHEMRTEGACNCNLKDAKIEEVTVISFPLVLIGAFYMFYLYSKKC